MTPKETIWHNCLSYIGKKVNESVCELWFRPIVLTEVTEDSAVLTVPNRFFREWIEDNYPGLLSEAIEDALSERKSIVFHIAREQSPEIERKDVALQTKKNRMALKGIYLNPKYTFENFIVGSSNQFAHAAAEAVSESVGKTYNPLFIYGDVGLGKTHIIHAIGNKAIGRNSHISVIYVSSEQFTNEVVTAIRHDKMSELKEKYRNVDMLLIDDVQFIANKTQTQEEFFHTFNALYERQKQIVISSDRPPRELGAITDRLKSRFQMGLIADIQPPTIELKMAILEKKAETQKISLPVDVIEFLATKIRSNIRELEGCLIKLAAYASLTGSSINLAMAKSTLKDILYEDDRPVTIENIQKMVCDYFGIKMLDMKAKKRTKEVTIPRQLAMYLSKRLTQLSLEDIGKSFGGRDHATVIYACNQVEAKIDGDESFGRIVEQLTNRLKP